MAGHLVGHLVRRGVQHMATMTPQEQYMEKLRQDAARYDSPGAGQDMEVRPEHLLPAFVTVLLVVLAVSTLSYSIGQVVSSLAMIESPTATTATAVVRTKTLAPPAYTDHPDAPREKAAQLEAATDVEITVLAQKPVTTSLRHALAHLRRIGGFFAQWRGLPLAVFYHLVHACTTKFWASTFGLGLVGEGFVYVLVSVGLARLHMAWTHRVITHPSAKPWYRRQPSFQQSKPVFRAALVHAAAEQASLLLPAAVALALRLDTTSPPSPDVTTPRDALLYALRLAAVFVTYVVVGLHVLLPASITLARIEAVCLPEGEDTIVAFDKAACTGTADVTTCAGRRSLFAQTWKSVDRSAKWRVIKLYVKLFLAQVAILAAGVTLVAAEIMWLGAERIRVFSTSASAQLQLMAIEAGQKQ